MEYDKIDLQKATRMRTQESPQDLAAELVRANETLQTLQIEVRTAVVKYRLWRAHMRCGRSVADAANISNLMMVKKIRGLWATYRFAQMVRADIGHMMALETETRQRLAELQSITDFGFKPEQVSYDELEARYGSATAQKLYDDMLIATAREVMKRKLVS